MAAKKFMVIGAHPDDCEIMCGGAALLLAKAGHKIKFVSCTDGSAGHQEMPREKLAARRYKETQASAKRIGLSEYEVMDIPDGELTPSLENREKLIRTIRKFKPDVVIAHRLCDYHADHRAAAQLVQDASYLLAVPLVCPDVPAQHISPIFLFAWDHFQKPTPFAANIAVSIDKVINQKLELYNCHVSQFYEWLPFTEDKLKLIPKDKKGRFAFLTREWLCRNKRQAEECRHLLEREYGEAGRYTEYAECFELSEYGRQPAHGELASLFIN